MKITFCGAAREVTGSCHLLTLDDGFKILLDCGMYQGGDEHMQQFNEKWLFKPQDIHCLILSHAHIDHTGRVPRLVKDGFRGTIYATFATRDLCNLMLIDSAQIQQSDANYANKKGLSSSQKPIEPYYTIADAQAAMGFFAGFNYEQWFHVHPNVRVLFRDAGHILGSASVLLEIRRSSGAVQRLGFTGDIGRPRRPILRDPQPMMPADWVICESTYGDRLHASATNEIEHFFAVVHDTCVKKKGKLIIPAFSVGRTQEIVYLLNQLYHAGRLPDIPVFVDSPLSVNATEVFINHPECFDHELHTYLSTDNNPFGFNRLHYIRSAEASKQLNTLKKPCIIIAASGMMNAGRIQHHLLHHIENHRNTFLIVGYCSPDTPGGKLRAGEKHLHVLGEFKQVLARVEIMDSFSAHGDRDEMTEFLAPHQQRAQKIFLVHGTPDRQENFRSHLLAEGFRAVEIPHLGDTYEL